MRQKIAAIFAFLVLVGVVAAAAVLLTSREDEREPAAMAAGAAAEYAAAWERWDVDAMSSLLTRPDEDFAALHTSLVDAVRPIATTVTLDPAVVDDNRARVPLTVSVEVPDGGTWQWRTELALQRAHGRWTVNWQPASLHPQLRSSHRVEVVVDPVQRAPILAHDGRALTGDGMLHEIGIEPGRIDRDEVVAAFRALLPEANASLERLLERDDLNPGWYYPVLTIGPDRFADVWPDLRAEAGVLTKPIEGRVRQESGDTSGIHVLGRVRELTDEEREGRPEGATDEVGAYGLEEVFDDQLTGSEELRIVTVKADGSPGEVLHSHQGDPSSPLATTLDADVQRAIELALTGTDAHAAIVAIDPATGGIRGAASRPVTGYNRAFEGRYAPGHVAGVITLLAALESGVDLDAPVPCPSEATVGGASITNPAGLDLGQVPLAEAVAAGCATALAEVTRHLDGEALAAGARAFGFDAGWSLPLPAFTASYPEPGDLAERARSAVGKGRVEASVLHLASVAAAITSGTWRAPTLLADAEPQDIRPLPRGAGLALRLVLRDAADSGSAALAAVDGLTVSGLAGPSDGADGMRHGWFLGAATGGPGAAAELALAVLVEDVGDDLDAAPRLAGRVLAELQVLAARTAAAAEEG